MFTSVNFFSLRPANAFLLPCKKKMQMLLLENKNAITVFVITSYYKE